MTIVIEVKGMVPAEYEDYIKVDEFNVTASYRIPTALPEVNVYGIPQQCFDMLRISQLKDKMAKTIVEHFAEIEKDRVELFLKTHIRQTPITREELDVK